MPGDKTLLAHLAPLLGRKPEIVATKALGYILSTSLSSKRSLEDLLKSSGADVGTISNVKTEAKDEELTTPDLACFDQHGVERVLIEAKFEAKLTDHQPVAYLKRLPTDKPSVLLFVVPAARFEELWTQLHRRVDANGMDLRDETKDADLRRAEVGGERHLMLTSWAYLLDHMAVQVEAKKDLHAACDIRQLLGLTQRMDEDAFLPLRAEELGPEFPRRVRAFVRLVKDVATRISREKWANWTGSRPSIGETFYGWYMLLAGARVWFGYWCDPWAQHRGTPLWLECSESNDDNRPTIKFAEVRHRLAPLQQEVPPGIIDEGHRLLVPIDLPVGVEYETLRDSVVKRVEYIAGLIGSPDATS